MRPHMRLALAIVGAFAVALLSAAPTIAMAKDANRDKIPDSWEAKYHLSTKSNVAKKDADKDGLKNVQEYLCHTNPLKKDTDHDGIKDPNEDADHDGLTNIAEFRAKTNPMVKDTNHDGISDANADPDGDRLNNAAETLCGTDPLVADADNDGTSDFNEDADQDGLENGAEVALGTDPQKADSDGDGVVDGDEAMGYVTSFNPDTGVLTLAALWDNDYTYKVTVNNDTSYLWGGAVTSDDLPTADDLQVGALVTRVDSADGDGATGAATAVTVIPNPATDDQMATVSCFDSENGVLSLLPSSGGEAYEVLVNSDTTYAWADGIYAAHRASKGMLEEDMGVTDLDIIHDARGNAVATKVVLVPDYGKMGYVPSDGDNPGDGDTVD